jgi:hypothetical protein
MTLKKFALYAVFGLLALLGGYILIHVLAAFSITFFIGVLVGSLGTLAILAKLGYAKRRT